MTQHHSNRTIVPSPELLKELDNTEEFHDDVGEDGNTWIGEEALLVAPSTSAPNDRGRHTVLPKIELADSRPILQVTARERRYNIHQKLGAGGVGEVFLAMDMDIGRRVAVKKIEGAAQFSGAMLRFIKEVQTIGRLEHPNIVPIHDVGQDEDGNYYFVMKYVEGITLERLIDQLRAGDPSAHARYGIEERVLIVRALAEAIRFAHTRGVIHRDIKPANVMIGPYGEVLLLDWGIAKTDITLEPATHVDYTREGVLHTRDGVLIGTPRYMSPEQANKDVVDQRSDVYSLSVLMHELLTLRHYLEGTDDMEALLKGVRERNPALASTVRHPYQDAVPMDLSWFVDRGVNKDPNLRYQTMDELIDRLQLRAEGHIPVQCPVTFTKVAANTAGRTMDTYVVPMMGALMRRSGWVAASVAMVAAVGLMIRFAPSF